MEGLVNIEDFEETSETMSNDGAQRRAPHHLPSKLHATHLPPAPLSHFMDKENTMSVEDFNMDSLIAKNNNEQARDFIKERMVVDLNPSQKKASQNDALTQYKETSLPLTPPEPRPQHQSASARFTIATDIDLAVQHCQHRTHHGCELVHLTRSMELCPEYVLENQSKSFSDRNSSPVLLDVINKQDLGGDCEFNQTLGQFDLPKDFSLSRESNSFNLTTGMSHNARPSSFDIHDGLDYNMPVKINLIGKTNCSLHHKNNSFSIPKTDENSEIHSKFSVPKEYDPTTQMKGNCKFSIPDYTTYKHGAVNSGGRFYLCKDFTTYRDGSKFSIPISYSAGWGFKSVSIPASPTGLRKCPIKSYIPDNINQDKKSSPNFKIAPPFKEDEDWMKPTFEISLSGELCNETVGYSDYTVSQKPFKHAQFNTFGDVELVNKIEKYSLAGDCEFENINLSYKINEIEIESSQLSLDCTNS